MSLWAEVSAVVSGRLAARQCLNSFWISLEQVVHCCNRLSTDSTKLSYGEHTYRNQCDIRRLGKRTTSGIRSKTNLAGTGKKKYGSVHCMGIISYTCFKSKCTSYCPSRTHLILKEGEFLAAIEKGLDFVSKSDKLLTLGIKPNRPETGYGYNPNSRAGRRQLLQSKDIY